VSAKINLGVTLGSLTLLVIIGVVVITGSKANEDAALAAKQQSIQNSKDIDDVNKTITTFVDNWGSRVNISNKINNNTQDKLLYLANISQEQEEQLINLARNQTLILKTQVANEKNIINNLTAHRIIANMSNANQTALIKHLTNTLTSETYSEQAEKKVASIVGNMTKEHQIIFKALNITANDDEKDSETDIAKLKQLLKVLEKDHKVPPGLAKK
jgi:hypothetical protein